MSAMILSVRAERRGPVDVAGLTPDRLAGMDRHGVGAMRLASGERVGDVFDVGDGDPLDLVIRSNGALPVRAGAAMRAGTLTVEGDAGDFAGQAMHGGKLVITGNAGDYAGAPFAGERNGMRGGILAILGNAGDRAGERLRRGLVLVGGSSGAWAGANMLAGTIVVAGDSGPHPGFGLKRGSLILLRAPASLPATFNDSGAHDLLFLTLLDRWLRVEGGALARFPALDRRMRRYCGDLACGGTGEILLPT